jgi:hypothetical protein
MLPTAVAPCAFSAAFREIGRIELDEDADNVRLYPAAARV